MDRNPLNGVDGGQACTEPGMRTHIGAIKKYICCYTNCFAFVCSLFFDVIYDTTFLTNV